MRNFELTMDYQLRFDVHVSLLIRKVVMNLKVTYNLRSFLNTKPKIHLGDLLKVSLFNYAVSVYGPCLDSITPHNAKLLFAPNIWYSSDKI